MAEPILLPKLGNTVESCVIVRWLKVAGDLVSTGEAICEVETDKSILEVESPVAGTLLEVFFDPGDEIPVMTPIAAIGDTGEDISSLRPKDFRKEVIEESHSESVSLSSEIRRDTPMVPTKTDDGERIQVSLRISPRAAKLAAQLGISPKNIPGSGPNGRIIQRDIDTAAMNIHKLTPVARAKVQSGDFAIPENVTADQKRIRSEDLVPNQRMDRQAEGTNELHVRGIRAVVAERMLYSMQTTAQLTLNSSADASRLVQYRARLKNNQHGNGLSEITINDLVLFVVSRTLPKHRELNAHFHDGKIIQFNSVNLGFAVDTSHGLMVPIIRNAECRSLKDLSAAVKHLTIASEERRISPDDLSEGTFTVSNLGSLGVESFTPILNPPQVALLGLGSIYLKPIQAKDGSVKHIPHIGLSLTINHQVVDGAPAARFLQSLARNISDMEKILPL